MSLDAQEFLERNEMQPFLPLERGLLEVYTCYWKSMIEVGYLVIDGEEFRFVWMIFTRWLKYTNILFNASLKLEYDRYMTA